MTEANRGPSAAAEPDIPNPMLDAGFRIPFHRIRPEHVVPGVRQSIEEARVEVAQLASSTESLTWATTIEPLDNLMERLRRRTNAAHHLLGVAGDARAQGGLGGSAPGRLALLVHALSGRGALASGA